METVNLSLGHCIDESKGQQDELILVSPSFLDISLLGWLRLLLHRSAETPLGCIAQFFDAMFVQFSS